MILDIIGERYYPKYPKIRQKDLGTDTSNKFIDTLNISNLMLDGIGGKPSLIASDVNKNLFNCWKAKSKYRYANQQRSSLRTFNDYRKAS